MASITILWWFFGYLTTRRRPLGQRCPVFARWKYPVPAVTKMGSIIGIVAIAYLNIVCFPALFVGGTRTPTPHSGSIPRITHLPDVPAADALKIMMLKNSVVRVSRELRISPVLFLSQLNGMELSLSTK